MSGIKKTAICGLWHVHAGGYIDEARKYSQVVGIWDEDPERLREVCGQLGIPAFASFQELLDSDADGVIVCSSTASHAELMVRIADAGKHIFTEKVLGITDAECERVEEAVRRNKVRFVISLPQKYSAAQRTLKQVADSGELGKINYIRYHNCHSGSLDAFLPPHFYSAKECGGGAMMDLGAHGMYIIHWLHGMPETFRSVFTVANTNEESTRMNADRVEDNALTVMGYADGCIALNETGFVYRCSPMRFEVCGERGTVVCTEGEVEKRTLDTHNETVKVPLLPSLPDPIQQFLTGEILEGCGIEEAKALTHMMVEAYR